MEKYLTLKEAEELTGIKLRTWRDRIKAKDIRAYYVNNKWYLLLSDIEAFFANAPTNLDMKNIPDDQTEPPKKRGRKKSQGEK